MRTRLVLLGLSVALLATCGGAEGAPAHLGAPSPPDSPTVALDAHGLEACNRLVRYQDSGAFETDRRGAAQKVRAEAAISKSGNLANESAVLLGVASQGQSETWALDIDSMTSDCLHLGWSAATPVTK